MNPEVIERINKLRNDRLHGAGWLSRQAINTLKLAMSQSQALTVADFVEEARIVTSELAKARPSMISTANYVHQFLRQIMLVAENENDLDALRSFAKEKGNEFIKLSVRAASKAAEYGCGAISDRDTVMTCSYSSAVCKAFELAKQKGTEFSVKVAESWVRGEAYGEITVKQLKRHQIPVEIVADEDMRRGISKADKAMVGADSILADGSLVNGIPTHKLALAAKAGNVPLYTICETSKFDIRGYTVKASKPEPGFDKTPPHLITGIITEKGTMAPSLVTAYIEEMARLPL